MLGLRGGRLARRIGGVGGACSIGGVGGACAVGGVGRAGGVGSVRASCLRASRRRICARHLACAIRPRLARRHFPTLLGAFDIFGTRDVRARRSFVRLRLPRLTASHQGLCNALCQRRPALGHRRG
ncbi:MAG TPA: hypothetical protein DCP91_08345 [Eggerthellaceae bacterium]|nr:hypothetical protein [Eggerthellaceae bacterium]